MAGTLSSLIVDALLHTRDHRSGFAGMYMANHDIRLVLPRPKLPFKLLVGTRGLQQSIGFSALIG
jgi:hypothetical protein